jgi:hypothetical protein
MDINLLSSISCEKRNNYESEFCENLNPDKVKNFLKPYYIDPFGKKDIKNTFFSKNEFSLEEENNTIFEYDKEYCASQVIDNNYKGFTYEGNKNQCLLFDSQKFDKKISNDILYNYNVKTFLKTKNTIDIKNIEDQHKYENYFVENNNLDFMPENIIKKTIVENKETCMKTCIKNSDKCKSIMYLEQPKKCVFYNKKVIKNNKDKENISNYDTYTTNNKKIESNSSIINSILKDYNSDEKEYMYCKINNDKCILDYSIDNLNNEDLEIATRSEITNVPIYNCGGLNSTNPFCTKEYNPDDYKIEKNADLINYTDCFNIDNINNLYEKKKFLNNLCKEKYGTEYIYDDNIYDTKSLINCDNGGKMAKCKMHFFDKNLPFITEDKIEHFSSYNTNNYANYFNNIHNNIFFYVILSIFLLLILYIIINIY